MNYRKKVILSDRTNIDYIWIKMECGHTDKIYGKTHIPKTHECWRCKYKVELGEYEK